MSIFRLVYLDRRSEQLVTAAGEGVRESLARLFEREYSEAYYTRPYEFLTLCFKDRQESLGGTPVAVITESA